MVNTHKCTSTFEDCVTVSIDKNNPKLVYDVELGISKEEFKRVQEFIKRHYDFLDSYIRDKNVSIDDFCCYLNSWEESSVRVGITKDNYFVFVNTDEYEKYPHFHYVDMASNGEKFHTCIKIDNPEYLKHSLSKGDTLNEEQKNNLSIFLNSASQNKKFQGTNWDFIVMLWNDNNEIKVEEDARIPSYQDLK